MNANAKEANYLAEIESFLEKGRLTAGLISLNMPQPWWLISSIRAPVWLVRDGSKTRKVDGEWVDAIVIDFGMKVPGLDLETGLPCSDYLTGNRYAKLLEHIKLLIIAHVSCPIRGAKTTKRLPVFASFLMGVAEWLIEHRPQEAAEFGMLALDYLAIESILADCKRYGMGPGVWMRRLDNFLREQFNDPAELNKVIAWEARQSATVLQAIDDAILAIDPIQSPLTTELRIFTLDENELRWSKRWLAMNDWYGQDGLLRYDVIAPAIFADASRMQIHDQFRFYLRQFENNIDYRAMEFTGVREKLGHRQERIIDTFRGGVSQGTLRNFNWQINKALRYGAFCEELSADAGWKSIKLDRVPAALRGAQSDKTPIMPVGVALHIYNKAIHWALHYSQALTDYYIQLMVWVQAQCGHIRKAHHIKDMSALQDGAQDIECEDWWQKAFETIPLPPELADLNIVQFYGWSETNMPRNPDGSHSIATKLREAMTVEHAMRLNHACLLILTAAFSVRRDDEIRELLRECLCFDQGAYIDFALCKKQIAGIRLHQRRPIPTFLYQALQCQQKLSKSLAEVAGIQDEYLENLLFLTPTRIGAPNQLSHSTEQWALDLFCDYIETPLINKRRKVDGKFVGTDDWRRWYIRLHECRRFFAIAFFWLFDYKSLTALAWYMGHKSPKETEHYIRQSLTDEEYSQIHAQKAAEIILDENQHAGGADALREMALHHFGVSKLEFMEQSEIEYYLQRLSRKGTFKVTWQTIQTAEGDAYEVVVVVQKEAA